MTEEKIYEILQDLFSEVLDVEDIVIDAETTADDVEDWNSLSHITLISAVENEFGIRFKMGEVVTMKNVGDMVALILERI